MVDASRCEIRRKMCWSHKHLNSQNLQIQGHTVTLPWRASTLRAPAVVIAPTIRPTGAHQMSAWRATAPGLERSDGRSFNWTHSVEVCDRRSR